MFEAAVYVLYLCA